MNFTECNRCGKCREICPSYKIFMNESYSPRGRAQIFNFLKDNKLLENRNLRKRIFSCLLCGNCVSNCPLQVNLPIIIYEIRENFNKNLVFHTLKYFFLYPRFFFTSIRLLSNFKFLFPILKKQNLIPLNFLNKISHFKNKTIEKNSLKIFHKVKPKGRVALFLGCSTRFLMPSISNALVDLLTSADFEVIIPKQNCCGAPLLSAGFKEQTVMVAKKNIEIYKSFNIEGVITPCPTCAHFFNNIYGEITGNSINVLKLSDLIYNLELSKKDLSQSKIFFHFSCHSLNYFKEASSILNLLIQKGDLNIEKKEGCCGFAGLFSLLFEQQSMDIMKEKVLEYEKADMILCSCPNCIIQFRFAIKDKKIYHYIEFIQRILKKGE